MKRLYAIYDKLAEEFGPINLAPTDAVAIRMFKNGIPEEAKTNMEDYCLFYVGDYDTRTGVITTKSVPVEVING